MVLPKRFKRAWITGGGVVMPILWVYIVVWSVSIYTSALASFAFWSKNIYLLMVLVSLCQVASASNATLFAMNSFELICLTLGLSN